MMMPVTVISWTICCQLLPLKPGWPALPGIRLLFPVNSPIQVQQRSIVDVSLDGGINWTELVNLDGAGGSLYWRTASIDLGAYAGMSDVMIGFRYTDGGGWLYGAAIDDEGI